MDEDIQDDLEEQDQSFDCVRRPMHTSRYTGHIWINEVLRGHERRCYNVFRLKPSIFIRLRDILLERCLIKESRSVSANEQLGMFLYAMGHGVSTGALCEHFQHSSQTVSHYVNHVTKAVAALRHTYIQLPTTVDEVHPRIRHDDNFYPFFQDAIGAIDGTHIPANILRSKHSRYRNRKGQITQNVLAAVSFDLQFQYVGVGWEGAAADMFVLNWALERGGFSVPSGKYYLADLGYANTGHFLTSYRGERYHLQDYQGRGNAPYRNMKDKFNHRHAQLRNVVERSFGVLKNRFQTLKEGNLYPFRTQMLIVLACCVIHNFIRREQGDDFYFNESGIADEDGEYEIVNPAHVRGSNEMRAGEILRNTIANQLWLAP